MKGTAFVFRLVAWAAGGFVVGFIASHSLYALTPPRLVAAPAAIEPRTASDGHQFASDAGIMLKFIKPDRTGDFEATINRLSEALARSNDAERRQQAHGWRVFKAIEPATNGDAVYMFRSTRRSGVPTIPLPGFWRRLFQRRRSRCIGGMQTHRRPGNT